MSRTNSILYSLLLFISSLDSFSQTNQFKPKITGQVPLPLTTSENTPLTIGLNNLIVTDEDPTPIYPNGFTLVVSNGKDYSVQGSTVIPDNNFSGRLNVAVRVNDGKNTSNKFDVRLDVIKSQNTTPEITGQQPLSISQGQSLTVTLLQLFVKDPDNNYPADFTLKVYAGNNYTVSGSTVTPALNFTGILKVQVTVNDGKSESKKIELRIEVFKPQNTAPEITGQQALSINQGQPLTITLLQLTVKDPDNNYPADFTLKVYAGNNYTVSGSTVTPSPNFTGNLKVQVTVNDGKSESKKFEIRIEVIKPQNTAPEITGQQLLSVSQAQSLTLTLQQLTVKDPDNNYPADFTLKVYAGNNYTVSGNTIAPEANFTGNLKVQVTVNDGKNESKKYELQIDVVTSQNVAPQITGQVSLYTDKGAPISLSLSDLTVTDPDNNYPAGFTLKVSNGSNYVVDGNEVTPSPSFVGVLTVGVVVNDGRSNSPVFPLKIEVRSVIPNVAPVITGQKQISLTENTSLALQLAHLLVNDPDDTYPIGFVLKVSQGNQYTVSGNTITPVAGFTGNSLTVTVRVNDGVDDSPPFDLKVQVIPLTSRPRINGQKELTTNEDSTIQITLSDLSVTDADNPGYPQGFELRVLEGNSDTYRVEKNAVTPALNLNGFIEVDVTVSDGKSTSDVFQLSILVKPVNDPPEILNLKPVLTGYEPGKEPLTLFQSLEVTDVDSEFLSMAEVGFRVLNHSPVNDQLLIYYDSMSSPIRPIYDQNGILFLIGFASIEEYQEALRSIRYHYNITKSESGLPMEIASGPRTIYMIVSDGERISSEYELQVNIETKISIDIPNAFTPNGDHANDTWRLGVENKLQMNTTRIKVYGKRGEVLFDSIGFEDEWDGTYNGRILPVDNYYYTIEVDLPYTRKTLRGVVTILY